MTTLEKRTEILDKAIFGAIILYCLTFIFSISISQIAIFTAIGLWLIKNWLNKSFSTLEFPLWQAFAGFAGASLLSAAFAVYPAISFSGERILFHIVIFFLVVNQLRDIKQINIALLAILMTGYVAAFCGIGQLFETGKINLYHRIHGSLSIHMTYAGLLMLVFVYSLPRLLKGKVDKVRAFEWFFLIFVGIAIILSLTRNAWVGVFFGSFLVFFLKWKWKALLLPVVLAVSVFFFPQSIQERFVSIFSIENKTNMDRLVLWRNGFEMIKDYPILGVGHDNFQNLYMQYMKPADKFLGHMHNIYLTYLAEYGIVGLSAWLFMIFSLCRFYIGRLRENINEDERVVVTGALAAMTALLTAGFFEPNFGDTEINMFCYFVMALPFALGWSKERKTETAP